MQLFMSYYSGEYRIMLDGYCYHCENCKFIHLLIEPTDTHSRNNPTHHIERRIRSQCMYHIEMNQKFD